MNRIIMAIVASATLVWTGCGSHSGHDHGEHAAESHEEHGDYRHEARETHGQESDVHGADSAEGAHGDEIVLAPEQARAAGVTVETIAPSDFQAAFRVSGQILAGQGAEQTVAATADGIVNFTNSSIVEGTPVGSGQTIATLSSKNLQSGDALTKARAAYDAALSDYERAKKLVADRIISEKDYVQARLSFETARATYEGLAGNATSSGTAVKASAGGYVKSLLVRQGDYVNMGQPIAVITQNRRLQLRADVPANRIAVLPNIKGANFRQAGSDKVHRLSDLHGRMVSYGRAVNDGAAFVPVTFELDNVGDILSGAFAEVWVLSSVRSGVLALPVEALTEECGIKYIYVQVEPDVYQKREVRTGENDGRRVEILSGLHAGERVVTRGAVKVKMASMSASIPTHNHNH